MRGTAVFLAGFLAALLFSSTALANRFAEGNVAYQQGNWSKAIEDYEALVEDGVVHEDLYYNLGNAYFRDGKLGQAIFNYERALRVEPGMSDAEYNLEVAREVVAERGESRLKGAEVDPWWVRLATFFSMSQLGVVLLIMMLLLCGLLTALVFLPTGFLRTSLLVLVAFMGVGIATSGSLLALHRYVVDNVHQGILVSDLTVMREGPDATLAERGQLHPGLRVRILGQEGDWLLIRLANGVEGWVPESSVGRF
jgi:hypothetical protein